MATKKIQILGDIYAEATTETAGLMSAADKYKLDNISSLSADIIVDTEMSATSTNPVQNKAISAELNVLHALIGDADVSTQIADAIKEKADLKHGHNNVTTSESGFMSADDKNKLDSIDEGANRTVVDSVFNATSANPVQNAVIVAALEDKADVGHEHTLDEFSETTNRKFMTQAERDKLDDIADGANKTVVDTSLSAVSNNPISNMVVCDAIDDLRSLIGDTDISSQIADAIADKADNGHTHDNATTSKAGFMSSTDKSKLNGISSGANKTTVDSALSSTSTNPVQNKVLYQKFEDLSDDIASIDVSSQISTAIANKANKTHTHSVSDLTSVTASATEINKLDGVTVTTAEINYLAGVTSNIQNQLDDKLDAVHTHDDKADVDHTHDVASTEKNGFMSAEDKEKLESISLDNLPLVGQSTNGKTTPSVGSNGTTVVNSVTCTIGSEIFNDYRDRTGTTYSREGNVAVGNYSHAEGRGTTAVGTCSHAEGCCSVAYGSYSHAGGYCANAQATYSFAHGDDVTAKGDGGVVFGRGTISNYAQMVIGTYNQESYTTDHLVIGNGTSSATRSNAFRIGYDGTCYTNGGTYNTANADFAEYFEWLDRNVDNEDRRGRFVTLDGDKIRFANAYDDYILGVVSASGAFVGNAASENWQGKYLVDEFGATIHEDVEIPEEINEVTGEITPAHIVSQRVLNPDYNPEENYISREFRPEWDVVGMLGQLVVVDDGTCVVNGYCSPSIDGIGTASDHGYRVMKRIDDTHVKVLVR